ncbi:wd-40 repeat protein [Chrysochromulina tobinii]|uniref:Wd-40 repeat protein n=1 Tax=Chrysochromulina tobinii TaxID=1460289 RepID=A0A0M0LRC7_9EUKA|nr:wd-40 repeat protein [Chrysochromulina tobinii]|eukprot:KOO53303.1 wd-40 repeat protein [Chrysochromulina sp. CCMP291]
MNPEHFLGYQTDTGVAGMSESALKVLNKYKKGGAASATSKQKSTQPVLLSAPAVKRDAPLTDGERKAKLRALARKRLARLLGQAYRRREEDSMPPLPPPIKVRSVASALAAREDLPVMLGGELEAPGDELETAGDEAPVDDAPADAKVRLSTSLRPELFEPLRVIRCDELGEEGTSAFCVRFSPDGLLLAAGCGDGTVRVFHSGSGRPAHVLSCEGGEEEGASRTVAAGALPVTCVRWTGTRTVLATTANGRLHWWRLGSSSTDGASCPPLHSLTEADALYALALSSQSDGMASGAGGGYVATAGKDTVVRVYDEATRQLLTACGEPDAEMRRFLGAGGGGSAASAGMHTSRLFCVRFVPGHPQLIASAGWDATLRLFDTRTAAPLGASSSIATAISSSWAPVRPYGGCKLYAAQFCSSGRAEGAGHSSLVAAAGVAALDGSGELTLLDAASLQPKATLRLPKAVRSLDVCAPGTALESEYRVALAAADHTGRCRPLLPHERAKDAGGVLTLSKGTVTIAGGSDDSDKPGSESPRASPRRSFPDASSALKPSKSFTFDHVYDENSTQEEVYAQFVAPFTAKFLAG